jgi:hypothetical protein
MDDPYDLVLAMFGLAVAAVMLVGGRTLSCDAAGAAGNTFAAFCRHHVLDRETAAVTHGALGPRGKHARFLKPAVELRDAVRNDRADRDRVIFASLTSGTHHKELRSLALRSVAIAGLMLLLFALGGNLVLSLLHVSLPAFRVAGGMLLFLQALTLTFSSPGLSSINDGSGETRKSQATSRYSRSLFR